MLTDLEASAARPTDRDYKLADAGGLYLFVTRSGFKSWRMKYRYGGKEKRLTFGSYPEVTLQEARARREQARALLRDNVDPGLEKQRLRAAGLIAGEEAIPSSPAPEEAPIPEEALTPEEAPVPEVAPVPEETLVTRSPAAATPPAAPPPQSIADRPRPIRPEPVVPNITPPKPTPAVAAEDEPELAAPFTSEVASGSRALALLRQAEQAAQSAASHSRVARRIAYAAGAVLALLALVLVWWLFTGRAPETHAASTARSVSTASPVAVPHEASPLAGSPASSPATVSPTTPPLSAPNVAPSAPIGADTIAPISPHLQASAAPVVPSRAVSVGQARRGHHHRHSAKRHHRRHGRLAAPSSSARSTSSYRASRYPSPPSPAVGAPVQETSNAITVTSPRGREAIDPALDRAGRLALCLRAAYSNSPGCAAVR